MKRAAGVILWREKRPFELEVAIVHRPEFDDWTFPKGEVETGESAITCAYREVFEETGIRPIFGPYLGHTEYVANGQTKRVQYWMAKAPSHISDFVPNSEVDQLEWVNVKQARHFLTFDADREILKIFKESERHVNVIILLRHAKAVKRNEWDGDDTDRPLNFDGQRIASKLVRHLEMFGISEVHSSDAFRCISSINELTNTWQVPRVITDQLSEYYFQKDDRLASSYVKRLAKFGGNYLICSHNPVLSVILNDLVKYPEFFSVDQVPAPADSWIVHHRGGKVFAVDYLKSPEL